MAKTGNFKMAIATVQSTKWRSFLTMLGIIIGVVSVVTTVSIGEGIKQQVATQIDHMGKNLITIRPGDPSANHGKASLISLGGMYSNIGVSTITSKDISVLQKDRSVQYAVPFSLVATSVTAQGAALKNCLVIATNTALPKVLNQHLKYGAFFTPSDTNDQSAVIGQNIALQLFHENAPIGMTFTVDNTNYIVRGVFDTFATNPLSPALDYNSAIFIPMSAARTMTNNNTPIYQVLVKPFRSYSVNSVVASITHDIQADHGGQRNFTVLKQGESLAAANSVLDLLTRLITGVAAISLIVGGIGIMNIMLVSVTERTEEIGIRKAIGATSGQIMRQFLTEAVVVSGIGGLLGVLFSLVTAFVLDVFTNFQPVITLPVVVVAVGVSVLVGVIFGVAPALKAARQDPIEALRHV